jgi:Tol biopolymer transport system component
MCRTSQGWANRFWLSLFVLFAADAAQLFADDVPRITLATRRFGGVQLMTIGIDGSDPVQITKGQDIAREPAWSPDGSKLMYVVGSRGNSRVMIADADGSNAKPLLPDETRAQRVPQWSPDGKQIAMAINIPAKNMENIFLMNADGTELKDLDSIAPTACDPIFSPDGKKFACVSHPPGTAGWIWVYELGRHGKSRCGHRQPELRGVSNVDAGREADHLRSAGHDGKNSSEASEHRRHGTDRACAERAGEQLRNLDCRRAISRIHHCPRQSGSRFVCLRCGGR